MRVVLDTNVIVSGLLWQGTPGEIFTLARENQITICTSSEIVEELSEILQRPKFKTKLARTKRSIAEIVAGFLEFAEQHLTTRFPFSQVLADPSDDMFLACAVAVGAAFIVSGDTHLLRLKTFQGVSIVSPNEFLRQFKKK